MEDSVHVMVKKIVYQETKIILSWNKPVKESNKKWRRNTRPYSFSHSDIDIYESWENGYSYSTHLQKSIVCRPEEKQCFSSLFTVQYKALGITYKVQFKIPKTSYQKQVVKDFKRKFLFRTKKLLKITHWSIYFKCGGSNIS